MATLINLAVAAVSEETKALAASASMVSSNSTLETQEVPERIDLNASTLRQTYHELGSPLARKGSHVVEMDVLEQLKANMVQLEDMHARLKFMMAEVRYLVVREPSF